MSQIARRHPLGSVRPLPRHAERLLQTALALLIALGSLLSPDIPRPLPSLAPVASAAPQSRLTFAPAGPGAGPARFVAGAAAGTVFFAPGEIVLALPTPAAAGPTIDPLAPPTEIGLSEPGPITALRLRFEGANPAPEIASGSLAPGRINYFRGDRPSQWRRDLATFGDITYRQLYPGVSLRYEGREGALKGTYLLEAGVDPAQIRWRYAGAADLRVEVASGDLRIALPDGRELVERAPLAWQDGPGGRQPVESRYQLAADGGVSFALGGYDPALPLTIDPWLEYGTLLGGGGMDTIYDLARDSAGNLYVAGYTDSIDFPGSGAATVSSSAAFISKLGPDGTLISTSIIDGSVTDIARSVVLGPNDDVYVVGYTNSADFPLERPLQPVKGLSLDAFVLRLSNDLATLSYSTFLGGRDLDEGLSLAVDSGGAAYLSGNTWSDDFPVLSSLKPPQVAGQCGGARHCQDVFVSKISPDGQSLAYSTYFGGSDYDNANDIAVDVQNRAYLVGFTISDDIPTRQALQPSYHAATCDSVPTVSCSDIFLTRFTTDGQIDYSTYLGGFSGDFPSYAGLAVDSAGRTYLTGSTFSSDFPTAQPLQPNQGSVPFNADNADAFVAIVSPDGQQLDFSTYLGGDGSDRGTGIAIDATGNIYVVGATNASNFPVVVPLQVISRNQCDPLTYAPFTSSCYDAFVAKLAPHGSQLLYSTLLSGSRDDWLMAASADASGALYVAGYTESPDLVPGGALLGTRDGLIFKLATARLLGDWYVAPAGSDLNDCRATDRPCATLGAAITRAAAGSTIHVAAGTYSENLTIDVDLSILGAGRGQTIIDGTGRAGEVASVAPGVTASIADLTITGGDSSGNGGGGVYNLGDLSLLRVTVRGNQRAGGAGGVGNYGTLVLQDSQVISNTGTYGGLVNSGTMTVTGSLVAQNEATVAGGGIENLAGASLLIEATSVISGNLAANGGGGIANGGTLRVLDSTISNNTTSANSGGGILSFGPLELSGATVSNNAGSGGGGLFVAGTATATITSSTLSGNSADQGGAVYAGGSAAATIRFSTITSNAGTSSAGGLTSVGPASISVEGSVVAGNSAPAAPDLCGPISSLGHNLIGTGDGCGFTPDPTDQVGSLAAPLDPLLGPLADNGGPTWTHMVLPNSPLIDGAGATCPPADQRGVSRPFGPACDIGAVEAIDGFDTGLKLPDEVYSFPNTPSVLNPLAFFQDFGIEGTTQVITNTHIIDEIRGLDSLGMPIIFEDTNIDAILPISITAGLTFTDTDNVVHQFIPRPVAWLYEEVIVKKVYESVDWGYEPAINGGLCVGMSASVGAFKGQVGPDFNDPMLFGSVDGTANSIPREQIVDLLAKYQGRQVGAQVLNYQADQGHFPNAMALYAHLVERMRAGDWWADPDMIGIYQGSGCDEVEVGHALLPYKLMPQADGTARIYVYDSNYPPQAGDPERYITVDPVANTWSYLIGTDQAGQPVTWTGVDLFGLPLHLFTQSPQLPYLDGNSIIAVGGRMRGSWGGGYTTWGRMRGSWGDPTLGESTGCLPIGGEIRYVEDISRSLRLRPLSGSLPPTYYFPADGPPLTITGTGGDGQTSGDILIFGPGGVMGFSSATTPGLEYSATINKDFHTLTLRTTDTPRPMTAFQMQEATDSAGNATTRVFAVSNVLVGSDGDISIVVSPDLSSVEVVNNRDEPVTFTLGLANYGSDVIESVAREYTIAPRAAYRYTPTVWEDLEQPIIVERTASGQRVAENLVSLHRFDQSEGSLIRSSAGTVTEATLRLARWRATEWASGALRITAPTALWANRTLADAIQRLDRQGVFTIELWADPADGGDRVATLVDATGTQVSLTLNQLRSAATVRYQLRLREGGDHKQASISLLSRPVSRGGGPLHLVITRDRDGQVRLFINGELQSTQRLRDRRGYDDDGPRRRHGGQIEDGEDHEDERRGDSSEQYSSDQRHGGEDDGERRTSGRREDERDDHKRDHVRSSLTLANDRESHHPWLGDLRLFALYSRALSQEEIGQNYQAR